MESRVSLDITWKTIAKVVLAGLLLYALFLTREIIIWFFFALVISILLSPAVSFFRRLRLPAIVAASLVYLIIFGLLGLLIYLISPLFIVELKQFSHHIPRYFETISPWLRSLGINVSQDFDTFTASFMDALQNSSANIVRALAIFFGGVASLLTIMALAFFISLEEGSIERGLALVFPKEHEHRAVAIFQRTRRKVAGWFGARIIACLFVGAASLAVFLLVGIHYAFTLALLVGVLNFIPYVGQVVAMILVFISAGVTDSWWLAVYSAIALLVIQEAENKLITPMLMKRILNIPPSLVLLSLLVGGTLFGFLGMIFMIPVAGIIYEFTREFLERRKEEPLISAPTEQSLQ